MISEKKINIFQNKINFHFKNKRNLFNCLIHPSIIKERKIQKKDFESDFERLEFLGDRILGLVVASLIFDKFIDLNEGDLTKKLSYLVQKKFLYKIALEINLDKILRYSFKKENIRMNEAILSDAVESLIGSIFIDSGYTASFKFIKNIWKPYLDLKASNEQDPKTHLQEISQQKYKILPNYKLLKKNGPSHLPTFTVSLKVSGLKVIKANGKSIREAEKSVAKVALELLDFSK